MATTVSFSVVSNTPSWAYGANVSAAASRLVAADDPSLKMSLRGSLRELQASEDLASCLRRIEGGHDIAVPSDSEYENAKSCANSIRSDLMFDPSVVYRPSNAAQAAEAVKCANIAQATVTPRSGRHGFMNEACSGELILDVSQLLSFSVDVPSKVPGFTQWPDRAAGLIAQ